MKYLSLFSGIEAASVAWFPLGWECAAVAEIDPFPCRVLEHHYPDVPNLGDITKITQEQIKSLGHIDLVVGGFPCQDLSVAGLRKGLKNADGSATRSGLFYTALQIARWTNARWLLLENVPGIYSSNDGRDFASMAGEILNTEFAVPKNGWQNSGVACSETGLLEWRTLDAQYFGVPQRRRRMFALADFGNWASREPVLFERHSLSRHTAPSRQKGKEITEVAGTLAANGGGTTRPAGNANELDFCITTHRMVAFGEYSDDGTASALKARDYKDATDLVSYGIPGNWIGRKPENGGNAVEPMYDVSPCLTKADRHGVAHVSPTLTSNGDAHSGFKDEGGLVAYGVSEKPDVAHCLRSGASKADKHESTTYIQQKMQVRRLTPRECERLQGFPETIKTCTITVFQHSNSNVCLSDQQSTNVLAALQSHKSPSNASPAEENVFPSNANAAELNLNAGQESSSEPVLVSAQIDLERQHLRLHSQGRLLLSANIADLSEWCRLPIQAEDFVQLSVALLACLEKTAPTGRAALHLNMSGSFPLLIGNWFASQSGREIEELASDAEKFMGAVKKCTTFITSEAGRNSQNYDSNLQTLLCCVSTVICSFIPSGILSASSYALSIEVSNGYTWIPWRKKPAAECPDGPRYKALGNSFAVPVVRWIGERIQMVQDIQRDRKAA